MLSRCNCVRPFVTPRAVACEAPLAMEFSRQEYWSGLPFSPPGDLPDPGIEPKALVSPALQADSLLFEPSGSCVYVGMCVCVSCVCVCVSPALQADSLLFEPSGSCVCVCVCVSHSVMSDSLQSRGL